jgi:hypothetical protein
MTISDRTGPEPGAGPPHGPYWEIPDPYGQQDALNSMGTIAAPLLAGFSLAAMVQTLTVTADEARWRDAAFLLFMLAAVLFVTAVQAMFWARGYQTTPSEIMAWWPDAPDSKQRLELLRKEQRRLAAGFRMWSDRARVIYGAALLCLLAALTVLAVPPQSDRAVPFMRWLAVAVGATAFIAEAVWIVGSSTNPKWMAWLLQPPRGDTPNSSSANPEP